MASTGERLADLRESKRWTQQELADKVGVVRTTISSYENDIYLPEVEKLVTIADIFEVSVDYLLCRSRSELKTSVFDKEFTKVKDKSISLGTVLKKQINLSKRSKNDLIETLEYYIYRDTKENKPK